MDLQAQIDELKRQLEALSKSNAIPRSVETAFRTRLSLDGYTGTITTAAVTGTGATGSMTFSKGILVSQVQAI